MKLGRVFAWLDPVVIATIYLMVNLVNDPTFVGLSGLLPLVELGLVYVPIIAFRFQYRLWQQASIYDIYDYLKIFLVYVVSGLLVLFVFQGRIEYFITAGITFLYLFVSRFTLRLLTARDTSQGLSNVLIYGAGEAGSQLYKSLVGRKNVVAFIDDDETKVGILLHGKPILRFMEDPAVLLKQFGVSEVFIAIPTLDTINVLKKAKVFSNLNIVVQVLPSFEEVQKSNYKLETKPIQIKDVLGREEVQLDLHGIESFLTDQVVLITGAGGSIGSELARQVARFPVKSLILIDNAENGLFFIAKELSKQYNNIIARVASIQDVDRLDELFSVFSPTLIYHAAAHKHVGLMEESPSEAVKNNVIGSLNVMEQAIAHKVGNVVMISTDKAVRPTNVMGASKQIVERCMQTLSKSSTTVFSAVRFGNVLGSSGSVIPIFESQIAQGGPVTVTDPEVKRYFMTIPEATQLVMETSLYATSGNIFILDMGEPVLIKDLAERMIRLAGYEPYKDIEICFTGLGAGEKLFEELILDESVVTTTPNQKILLETTPLQPVDVSQMRDLTRVSMLVSDIINEAHHVS